MMKYNGNLTQIMITEYATAAKPSTENIERMKTEVLQVSNRRESENSKASFSPEIFAKRTMKIFKTREKKKEDSLSLSIDASEKSLMNVIRKNISAQSSFD